MARIQVGVGQLQEEEAVTRGKHRALAKAGLIDRVYRGLLAAPRHADRRNSERSDRRQGSASLWNR
jgi:hypothetical protein